jgi:DNA-directed RNA polymerase specialized sigma24 family protein
MTGLEWLALRIKRVRAMTIRLCENRPELQDELYGVVVDHVDGTMATYDPSRGVSVDTHMFGSLRLYCIKHLSKVYNPERRHEVCWTDHVAATGDDDRLLDEEVHEASFLEGLIADESATESVQSLWRRLDPLYADILWLRDVEKWTFDELAEYLGVKSHNSARQVYYAARREARMDS